MSKTSRERDLRGSSLAARLTALSRKRHVTKEDVAALRASDAAFGLRSKAEAELMFAIERKRSDKCRAWGDFLVEAITDFAVWDQRPSGVLTEETALWLTDQIGETPTPAGLAMLVSVLDEAEAVPAWFAPAVRLRASKMFGRTTREALQQAA